TLSVFADVPVGHKLESRLLTACMTDENLPWISPVVHKICLQTVQDPSLIYEYLPDPGLKSFIQASLELLFGKHSPAIVENRAGGVHTIGESGAFRLAAQFFRLWHRDASTVCIVSCQKESHGLVFQDMGFEVCEYCIWDPKKRRMDSNVILKVAEQMPSGCILVIGNPIDCRLTQSQWAKLMSIMKSKQIFPFFDIPCQGLSTGDPEEDAGVLRYFVSSGFEFFCSQFLSRNFGVYDEVVGILVVVARNNEQLLCVLSQLLSYAQALWLNPPSRGSRIITTILCNPTLQEEWNLSLKVAVENMMLIKEKVKEKLRLLGTPGSWNHITEQMGTHGYLGLNYQQVQYLIKKKHIYIPRNGYINFTCINASNIDYITQSISEAVLFTKDS
uniref:Putative aspartate aminotransferase, cytoplasmic 2 n=1 Tax=Cavia porcellus TaxID=10141 RepID=H0W9B3_CAVPO